METKVSSRRARKYAADPKLDHVNLVHIAPCFYEILLNNIVLYHGCRDSVVYLATHYGMHGQEFETRWGQNISFSPYWP